jgi:putative transposase
VSDLECMLALLQSIDKKSLALIRYMELQIQFLRQRVQGRLLANEAEKVALARLAAELGLANLAGRENLFHPETLLRWHREQIAAKFNAISKHGRGRPPRWRAIQEHVQRISSENSAWGSLRITGHLHTLGYDVCSETVRRIMVKLGLDPDPKTRCIHSWSEFIERHQSVLAATDFFTAEVWERGRLTTYTCLFVMHLDTRKVCLAGLTQHPREAWMKQMARNLSMEDGFLQGRRMLIMDRDAKFTASFRALLAQAQTRCLRLPWRSPNLNAFAERWVRSVKEECLNHFILTIEIMLWEVLTQFVDYYNTERPHQGLNNTVPLPAHPPKSQKSGEKLQCKSSLGGLLKSYYWQGKMPEKQVA